MSCVESSALERGARCVRPPSERVGDCAWTDEASTRSEARSTAVFMATGRRTRGADEGGAETRVRQGENERTRPAYYSIVKKTLDHTLWLEP